MKLATGLRTLVLRFCVNQRYEEEGGGFEAPFANFFQHNQLKSVTIESSMMVPKDLFYFLDNHRATLEDLELVDSDFFEYTPCEWPNVLNTVARSLPDLTHCRIDSDKIKADEALGAEMMDRYEHHKAWDFKGLGVVKEKLELMAKSVRWNSSP